MSAEYQRRRTLSFAGSGIFFLIVSLLILWGCSEDPVPPEPARPLWNVLTMASTNSGLVSDTINQILIGANSRVWFATDSGVSAYFRGTWMTFRDEVSYSIDTTSAIYRRVTCIATGTDLGIWFGLAGGGVRRHSEGGSSSRWESYTTEDGLLTDYIRVATTDRTGDLWFATAIGISRVHPLEGSADVVITNFGVSGGTLPTGNVTAIRAHPVTGVIWIGTRNGDLVSYDGFLLWEQLKVPKNASPVRCIAFENASGSTPVGSIWVGTDNGAFRFTSTSGWKEYSMTSTNGAMPSDFINAIIVTVGGTVWMGTDQGLAKLSGGTWTLFNTRNSPLPSDKIISMVIDDSRTLWLGTTRGVAQFNEEGIP
jgi:ligand-binding sensor domain-containing protein